MIATSLTSLLAVIGAATATVQSAAGDAAERYAFCYAHVGDVIYHSAVYRGQGDEVELAGFTEALRRSVGAGVQGGLCSARADPADAVSTRDIRFQRDLPSARMTTALPPGRVVADAPGASVPDVTPPGDGSSERPLILDCVPGAGTFTSLSRLYPEPNRVKIRIAGPIVSFWRPAERLWSQHPCVEEPADGQFCTVTSGRVQIKDYYDLRGGLQEIHDLVITPGSTGRYSFTFRNMLIDTSARAFVRNSEAEGRCRPGRDPAA